MAGKRGKPAKPKAGRAHTKLLVVAITLFWAASNEPAALGVGPVVTWALTALAVGLLACAALALAEPGMKVLLRLSARRKLRDAKEAEEQP